MTNGKWKTENIPYAHSPLGFRLFGHLPGLLFDERRAGDQVAARGVDQLDALGAASGGANLFGFEADQFAVAGDDQHFAVFGDRHDGDHLAVLLGGLNVDHAFAAARLHAVFRERRLLAETVAGDAQHLLVAVHGDDADHVIVVAQRDAAHAAGLAPHVTHLLLVEADGHALVRGQEDLLRAVSQLHSHQFVAFVNAHRNDAVLPDVAEFGKLRLLDHSLAGDHHGILAFGELANRDHARDLLARRQADQVDDGLAFARRRGVGDLMDFQFIDLPLVGEDHQIAVGRGDEDVRDDVLRSGAHALAPGPAAPLRFIHRQRRALDVARKCQRDHHVLVGYQVFERQLDAAIDDLRAALVGVILLDRAQFLDDHAPQRAVAYDLAAEGDEFVERLGQVEDLRLAVDDREVDHPERDLHLRHLVQLVQDDL